MQCKRMRDHDLRSVASWHAPLQACQCRWRYSRNRRPLFFSCLDGLHPLTATQGYSSGKGIMLYHHPFYIHTCGLILLCIRQWRRRQSEWWASLASASPLFSLLFTELLDCHLSGLGQPVKQPIYPSSSFYPLPAWICCMYDHYFSGKRVAEGEKKKLTLNALLLWVTGYVLWCLAISTEENKWAHVFSDWVDFYYIFSLL